MARCGKVVTKEVKKLKQGAKQEMQPEKRMGRVIALDTIANEAQKIADNGGDNLDIQNFVIGAREELAKQAPDTENYFEAAVAAKKARKK